MLFLTCTVFEIHSYSPMTHLIKGCNFINTACVSCLATILLYFSSHLTPSYVKRVLHIVICNSCCGLRREGRWTNQLDRQLVKRLTPLGFLLVLPLAWVEPAQFMGYNYCIYLLLYLFMYEMLWMSKACKFGKNKPH